MRTLSCFVCLAAIVVAPIACGGPQYGIGQGQPAYPERSVTGTARLPLAITSVFVAKDPSKPTSTQALLGYVQIVNQGTTAIDFNQVTLSLVSASGTVALDPTVITSLQAPLEPNTPRPLTDASLATFSQGLSYPSGQAAIIDDTFVVQAYIGWGTSAPTVPYPELTALAIDSSAIASASESFTVLAGAITPATSVYIKPPSTVAP